MKFLIKALILCFFYSSLAYSSDYKENIESFLQYKNIEKGNKTYNPLYNRLNINIPDKYNTILDSLEYVLSDTSYSLSANVIENKSTRYIVLKNLPSIHRNMNQVTPLEALKYIIGEHHIILIDPVIRAIDFEFKGSE